MIRRILRARFWMLGMVAVFMLIAIVFHYRPVSGQEQWSGIKQVAPSELIEQLAKDNLRSRMPISVQKMKALKVGENPLYLIDTRIASAAQQPNQNPLCGNQMCLFLGYVSENGYQKALNLYLKPDLPSKHQLFQVVSQDARRLPCLVIKQLEDRQIQEFKLCFRQGAYEVVETQRLPERYE